jgi:exopolysaccharide biosynthesis polyprenyl glycosylphosphotransferase
MAIYVLHLDVPRSWLARLCVSAVACVAIARAAARKATHVLQAGGAVVERAVVIGTNEEARLIARTLLRQNWMGIRPVAFVATAGGSFDTVDELPVAGSVDDVVEVVRRSGADRAILASTALPAGELARLTALLHGADVDLQISAGLPQVAASRVTVEALDGLPMLNVRRNQLSHRQAIVKRAIDILASSLLLALGAPLLAVLAVIVRATSTGPSLFRQTRVGEGGRTFTIFKFRTMVVDAEARKAELLAANEADGVLFKMQNDPRITRVGGTLRKLGLDELPQLINVLRGEMSLVGPRPPLPDETARYDEWVAGRLKVKPGITGLWQVNGRHELSFADYIRYDLFYVENWSVSLDLYVIARTLPALLARRGAA